MLLDHTRGGSGAGGLPPAIEYRAHPPQQHFARFRHAHDRIVKPVETLARAYAGHAEEGMTANPVVGGLHAAVRKAETPGDVHVERNGTPLARAVAIVVQR